MFQKIIVMDEVGSLYICYDVCSSFVVVAKWLCVAWFSCFMLLLCGAWELDTYCMYSMVVTRDEMCVS